MAKLSIKESSNLEEIREFYLKNVDKSAEQCMSSTFSGFKTEIHLLKYQEAIKGGGPLLSDEADGLSISVKEVVRRVLAARESWETKLASVEKERICAKAEIRKAGTSQEMYAIWKECSFSGN